MKNNEERKNIDFVVSSEQYSYFTMSLTENEIKTIQKFLNEFNASVDDFISITMKKS